MKSIVKNLTESELKFANELLIEMDKGENWSSKDIDDYCVVNFKDGINTDKVKNELAKHNLIEFKNVANNKYYIRTKSVSKVISVGGSVNYIQYKEKIQKEKSEAENLQKKKLRNETKFSELQIMTFWPMFIIGVLAFLLSVINLLNSIYHWW